MNSFVLRILILFLTCSVVGAQQSIEIQDLSSYSHNRCGVKPPTKDQIKYTLDVIDRASFNRNSGTTQLPIRLHIVTEDDGTGGVDLDYVNLCIAQLNNRFYELSIEWYIVDMNYISSSNYYDFEAMTDEEGLCQPHEMSDAVNIFFVNSLTVDSYSVCGFSYYPADMQQSLRMFMKNECVESATNGTFVHEFGHFFNLFHTHEYTSNGNTAPNAEHVARIGLQSNCGTAGDLLCDTNADPAGNINSNCIYIDGATDSFGNTYNPPVSNLMSYYPKTCGWIFTDQQYTRMGNALATRLAHTNYDVDGAQPNIVNDPSGLNVTINGQYQVVISWNDNASNESGYLIERSLDGVTFEPLFLGGVGPDITSYIDSGVNANTMYYYRVKASNDDPDHYSNIANVFSGQLYCIPSHQFDNCTAAGVGVGIQEFDLSAGGTSLMNVTSGCDGPLSIFTGLVSPPTLNTNDTYDFNVVYVNSGGVYIEQNISIWIDANQDGDFSDSGELLYQSNLTPPANVFFGESITIPMCAEAGLTTLRVRTRYLPNGPVEDPCEYYNFGETEDYPVTIISSGGSSSIIGFTENSGTPNDGTICDGDQVTLTASGGTSYLWDDNSTNAVRIVNSGGTYTVTVTDDGGCVMAESITINSTVNPNATIFISETSGSTNDDGLLCNGDSAQLLAGGGSNFLWENNSLLPFRTISSSGTYAVTVTTSNGCSDSAEVDLQFSSAEAAIAISEFSGANNDDGLLCNGETALLTASGGVSYNWQDGLTSPTRNVTSSGTYSVTVYDAAGCSGSSSIDVTVLSSEGTNIAIDEESGTTPNDGQLCQGDFATLSASGGVSYLWSTTDTQPTINVDISGMYAVTITGQNGCTAVESANIIVNSIDQATITIIDGSGTSATGEEFCNGEVVTLMAGDGVAYLWNDGSTAASRTVSSSGDYSVTVTNQFGCQSSASQQVIFNDGPVGGLAIIETSGVQVDDGMICLGDAAMLIASGGISYQWSTNATQSSLVVNEGGTYTVTITSATGCASVQSANIIVNSTDQATITIIDGSGTSATGEEFCNGEIITLVAGDGVSYSWSDGSTAASRTVSSSGDYSVTVTNQFGCQSSASQQVLFNEGPESQILVSEASGSQSDDGIICQGDSATLTVSEAVSVIWSDNSTSSSISVSETGTYSVTITGAGGCTSIASVDINSAPFAEGGIAVSEDSGNLIDDGRICSGDIVEVSAFGGETYLWEDGSSSSLRIIQSAGTYTVTITNNNGCSSVESIEIIEDALPTVAIAISEFSGNIPNDGILCSGDQATMQASGGDSYLWNDGSNNSSKTVDVSGIYGVTVSNANGCIATAESQIEVVEAIAGTITIQDASGITQNDGVLCEGDQAVLNAIGGEGYTWSTGSANASIVVNQSGEYQVTVVDNNGCLSQSTAEVNVYEVDQLAIALVEDSGNTPNDGILCDGDIASLQVQGGSSITWSDGSTDSNLSVSEEGVYTVSSTNEFGCVSSEATSISYNDIPELDITSEESSGVQANDNKLCAGENAILTATSNETIIWENNTNQAVRVVGDPGIYRAQATNQFGCTTVKEVTIEVFENPEVDIEVTENSGGIANDGIIDFGDEALLRSTGANSYLWEDGSTVDVRFVDTEGEYQVEGASIEGCKDSDVASIIYSVVLSLKSIQVDAEVSREGINLSWSINSDNHIESYTIEKGTANHEFEAIGNVVAEGSSDIARYTYLDSSVDGGEGYYYRIKGNTYAGEPIYSAVVYIDVPIGTENELQSLAYPNPVINTITFNVDVQEEGSEVELDLADESGRVLWSNYLLDEGARIGEAAYFVDLSSLNPGIYLIKLRVGRTAKTHKVIIID